MAFGIFFRVSATFVFLGLTYSFLVDKTIYNNHYYLFILISFLMVLSPLNEPVWNGIKKGYRKVDTAWLHIFRFQLCIVYFFGAVNKINTDWLIYAEPMYTWLPELLAEHGITLTGASQRYAAFFFSYAGLFTDFFMGVFLFFNTPLRKAALVIAVCFNLINAFLFKIGLFPWFNLFSLVLFLPPIPQLVKKIKLPDESSDALPVTTAYHTFSRYFLTAWVVFQLLFPLRHWLIPGWYLWDERGMFFSWTMKLRDKEPIISIQIKDRATGNSYYLDPGKFVMQRQLKYLAYRPVDMVHFAHFLKSYYHQTENMDIGVYAEVFIVLNHYRKPQLIINPYVDLGEISVPPLYMGAYNWIVPLGKDNLGVVPPDILR